jgi:hypothetical protein
LVVDFESILQLNQGLDFASITHFVFIGNNCEYSVAMEKKGSETYEENKEH